MREGEVYKDREEKLMLASLYDLYSELNKISVNISDVKYNTYFNQIFRLVAQQEGQNKYINLFRKVGKVLKLWTKLRNLAISLQFHLE